MSQEVPQSTDLATQIIDKVEEILELSREADAVYEEFMRWRARFDGPEQGDPLQQTGNCASDIYFVNPILSSARKRIEPNTSAGFEEVSPGTQVSCFEVIEEDNITWVNVGDDWIALSDGTTQILLTPEEYETILGQCAEFLYIIPSTGKGIVINQFEATSES